MDGAPPPRCAGRGGGTGGSGLFGALIVLGKGVEAAALLHLPPLLLPSRVLREATTRQQGNHHVSGARAHRVCCPAALHPGQRGEGGRPRRVWRREMSRRRRWGAWRPLQSVRSRCDRKIQCQTASLFTFPMKSCRVTLPPLKGEWPAVDIPIWR